MNLTVSMRSVLGVAVILGLCAAPGCSKDMQDQPSYHPQEAPRKHSPEGSVPRLSRAVAVKPAQRTEARLQYGARLFAINCTHCHGAQGEGDGPVASYLKEPPANLHNPRIQSKPDADIYEVVTNGKEDEMPSFKGLLSAEERWAVAHYVKALKAER
jgi:mono/diheme cytochrome c family protein